MTTDMKMGQAGLDLLKHFEGFRGDAYLCPGGKWTIGYGCCFYPDSTPVRKSDRPVTEEEAERLLANCLRTYEAGVNDGVTSELNQNQFDALVSFTYNVGVRAFLNSTLLKKVEKNPSDPAIKNEFLRWTKVKGKSSKGLERRRKAESDLYFRKVKGEEA